MKIIPQQLIKYVFFSQNHFDKNKLISMELIKYIVGVNKTYPSVCTHFYGCYFIIDLFDVPIFATHITIHQDGSSYKYDDKIFLGKVLRFSHYPTEILLPEEYADPKTQRVLQSDYFLQALH